ncbi:uL15 family ribosomal protein [Vulcanisaeta souniana]|uniref:Large ribosomal subunit protein uL15 n=1 Tax=Vulcanisaeta souniana JCM 11219 TaxID=1293586 RepID=A0A830DZQ1_9CREN|nr:uL15 family ribosomal protein [Vulcanisaeta souniana]BDR92042.1 50S ribosomal protein L15 [Vulcanisaeta souniana JCM 11219]GGI68367.1 50S ribosomal protein L15 [Vulcanisaeta souniana JCM 11219]
MVRRFERKSRKYRGLRTHSWGRVGQHRKSGSSGGRGKSGLHKHKWSLVMKYAEDTNGYPFFGKHGFKQPNTIVAAKLGINVGELEMMLDELVSKGLAQVADGKYVIDLTKLGFNKLLGRGRVTKPMIIKAVWISRKAEEKVRAVGGSVELVRGVVHG